MTKKKQFNILVEPLTSERVDKYISQNSGVFPRRGIRSKVGELLLNIGLDVVEKQILESKLNKND